MTLVATLIVGALLSVAITEPSQAEPVDDSLIIDGELQMTTRVKAPPEHPLDEILSGWLYRTPETRAMEADSFENPGMLYVEQGEDIWNQTSGALGRSCATCHGDATLSMNGVGAHYPKWHAASERPINIELRINQCRIENMAAEPYAFDSEEQKALTTYIKYQSLGQPVAIDLDAGGMRSWWGEGKNLYYRRMGQLNLACASCHENYSGRHLRADHLSQGNSNGFPTYRLKQASMVSLHNRFRGCIRDTRAEFPPAFSDELMALEVYLAWRGAGLSVETPAVRQ